MLKGIIAVIALSVLVGGMAANADPGTECLAPTASAIETGASGSEVAQRVLCCCNTRRGQCCKYVSFCGSVIPGCLCSSWHRPETDSDSHIRVESSAPTLAQMIE